MKKVALLIIVLCMASACAHKSTVKADQDTREQSARSTDAQNGKSAASGDAKKETTGTTGAREGVTSSERSSKSMAELQGTLQDVFFDFDKYSIRTSEQAKLRKLSELLGRDSGLRVTVEGNCDERGTAEYNLALGDRRANEARKYLESLGIHSKRISTVSYGEEKPLCTQNTEDCFAKNRRDHFLLTQ